MTLDQLRVFVAVAEHMHVTRAAQKLNMTQSAASAAIAALEMSCGLKLFDRIGRNISLTVGGAEFLAEAKAVVSRAGQAERALAEIAGLQRGQLQIYASQTIAGYWLPPILYRFQQSHPKIALSLVIGNTQLVAKAVSEGQADLGFVEGPLVDDRLDCMAVANDELVMVVCGRHPWGKATRVLPRDLHREAWVLREAGSGTRRVFEDAIRQHGIDPASLRVVLELPSNEAVRAAVEAGAGATVISKLVIAAGLKARTLRAVKFTLPHRQFFAIRLRDRSQSRMEEALLSLVGGRS